MRALLWVRSLTRRQVIGLALLTVILVTGGTLRTGGEGEEPSAGESERLGWHAPHVGEDVARDVFERINDERVERDIPVLVWHEGLADKARGWSEHMIASGEFEHSTDAYRAHPRFLSTGENIAISHPTSAEVHVELMRSLGHRRNILNPSYEAVGIGVVCRRDGLMWVTQIFGVKNRPPADGSVNPAEGPITRDDRGLSCP